MDEENYCDPVLKSSMFDEEAERRALLIAYERFRRTGKIPLGAITERDLVRPLGVSLKTYYDDLRINNLQTMIDIFNYYGGHSSSERQQKSKRIKRIVDKALTFKKVGFITITLNDEWLSKFAKDLPNARKSLKRILLKSGISRYELLADYGSENKRLHFHGVVELDNATLNLIKIYKTKKLYHLDELAQVGYHSIFVNNDITQDIVRKEVNYMAKYMSKDIEAQGLTHWRIGSKT